MTEDVLMIAAGMEFPKKEYSIYKIENIYLNFSILGLATLLSNKGYKSVHVFQGDFKEINELIEEISSTGIDITLIKYPILISMPSVFSVSWTSKFSAKIKKLNPNIKIVLGGRWVIDKNFEWIKTKLPNIDFFCRGCPDEYIEKLLAPTNWDSYQKQKIYTVPFQTLNYKLLKDFQCYQPSIEICRGCGMKCDFCLEKDYPISYVKAAKDVITEIKNISDMYHRNDLNFYFEASMFNPTIEWATEFYKLYVYNNMRFKWRFETRIDTINFDSIKILSTAGLKVVDLGLESASSIQLLRMGKTKNPTRYLEIADRLLKVLHQSNVWVKLNILLYPGETYETIFETANWLEERKQYFKGVSINPFILYLNGEETNNFINKLTNITLVPINTQELYENGFMLIDLSRQISSIDAINISNELTRKFMNIDNFLDLKKMGYTKI